MGRYSKRQRNSQAACRRCCKGKCRSQRSRRWTHTFENLRKYDAADGHEIVYTIEEVQISGYTSGISGSANDGFTITNTITGKVSVPVTKKWIGEAGASATINLLANGTKTDSVILNEGNNWQYTFTDLEQYEAGQEIAYTIEEAPIAGYDSVITGNAQNGYTVTNTNTAEISVAVIKQWVGPAKDSVTVKLLADGVVKKAAVLNSASGWRHSFENLRKYDEVDGHEIVYTVEEARIDGYTTGISGSAKDVFIITNTIIKIPTYHCYAPKTGDESNLALWFSIAILSLGTLGVIAFFEKKRKRVKHNDR